MRDENADIDLDGIVLTDVATGRSVDLGHEAGVQVVTLIRHRF